MVGVAARRRSSKFSEEKGNPLDRRKHLGEQFFLLVDQILSLQFLFALFRFP